MRHFVKQDEDRSIRTDIKFRQLGSKNDPRLNEEKLTIKGSKYRISFSTR